MAHFSVAHVSPSDLPAINYIDIDAFNNPRTLAWRIFTHQSNEEVAWRLAHTVHEYAASDDSRWDKLVDDTTGEMIAFAIWQIPRKKRSEEDEKARKAEKERVEAEFKRTKKFPESANQRLLEDFWKATGAMREKYVDAENDYSMYPWFCFFSLYGRWTASSFF